MIKNRSDLVRSPEHKLVLDCLSAGIEAAQPESVMSTKISMDGDVLSVEDNEYNLADYNYIYVVGSGNAAGQTAMKIEELLGERIRDGVVISDDSVQLSTIESVDGNHPIPSESALRGAQKMLNLVDSATQNDLVITIVTGGGSALLPSPAGDLKLKDLQSTTEQLLTSGASIDEINAIRKHISEVKGGQLARTASPASVVGFVFSDVVGNDLSSIASGPITPDKTTYEQAIEIMHRYDLDLPQAVIDHLQKGVSGEYRETPSSDSRIFANVSIYILTDNFTALAAARDVARDHGYTPIILSSRVRGEASEAAKTHVAISEEILATGNPASPPAVLLSGGETTVTVTGSGDGGPNQEFALSAALELNETGTVLGCVDTDGIDGNVNAAGALVDAQTVENQSAAYEALKHNDVYDILDSTGSIIHTGLTGTNVNDLRIMVISEE